MKTIILFIIGLLSWLLLTNYQVVYSKVASFTNPTKDTPVLVASIDQSNIVTAEESDENIAQDLTSNTEETIEIAENIVESTEESIENLMAEEIEEIKAPNDVSNESDEIELDLVAENLENTEAVEDEIEPNSSVSESSENDTETDTDAAISTEDNKEEVAQPANTETVVATSSNNASTSEGSINPGMQNPFQSNMQAPMFSQNMMNPQAMNPSVFMNPMMMMSPMMMGMMSPMMNPSMMMNPRAMINHPINTMTYPQNINNMMMSMDPKLMYGMFGQPSQEYLDGEVPDQLPVVSIPGMPTQSFQNWPVNKVAPGVSREAKKNAFQTVMAVSPLSMHDMLGIMADKMPVEEGVTWDDAVEAMKLRANEVNFKFVGSSPLWKQIEAETDQPSAKVEMFRFCDATVARRILDVVPEFIVFLPCKIALLEDGEGKLWVMTMDWDISWMDFSQNPNNHLSKQIREDAKRIRDNLTYIMEGAATGDF